MIPDVSRERLLDAMARFDGELRDSQEWADWQEQGNRKYAIEHEGRLYPVKQIIVLATEIERGAFKGGDEANSYVEARGFKVIPIEEDRVRGAATPTMADRLARAVEKTQGDGDGVPSGEAVSSEPDDALQDDLVSIPQDLTGQPASALGAWQAALQTSSDFIKSLSYDYPGWLKQTFGDRIDIAVYEGRGLAVALDNRWVLTCWFNSSRGVYIWIPQPKPEHLALLVRHFPPQNLRQRVYGSEPGYRFIVYDRDDYRVLQDLTQQIVGGPMTPVGAAFAVLSQAGGGPLSLKEIYERAQQRGLIDAQVSQLDLASALQRDVERFSDLGGNMWVLVEEVESPQPKGFEPKKYFSPEASFWRIHFPRELWDAARTHGVIGIDWPVDSTNQSVQRLKRVKVGDRVVVYLRGAVIGSIGVVTRPFFDVRVDADATSDPFGGQYPQRIGVAWADAPAEPADLFDALKGDAYTNLYNRLKNPHTVIPLSREDYSDVLTLLRVDDVGTPPSETRLPSAWTTLTAFRDFARQLADHPYPVTELHDLARKFGKGFNESIDADDLIDDLRRLRLVASAGDDSYQIQPYVTGDPGILLGLMALALLLPIEGAPDRYELPARSVVPYLFVPDYAEREPLNDIFTTKFGPDGAQLLQWYAEAGFVDLAEDGAWPAQNGNGSHTTPDGNDPATQLYNQFLTALWQEADGTLHTDLAHAGDQALAPVPDLDARLRELAQELLIDTAIVRRIYRSLLAGRHVVLSGPPGTGKTELAKLLPSLLWREAPQTFNRLTTALDLPPVEEITEQRHGYAPLVVTATEDWGVRDVVGGIGPRLDDKTSALSYTIEHGALTRIVLQHYEGSDRGRRLPAQPHAPTRRDYRADDNTRYRGAWLVIDEFTRAPVDAAFGSLLTTLSGGEHARLAVPTSSGEAREVPLPRDFRIIGTLNSFDRHFLNQISEAMKRRFDFIDVLPPHPRYAPYEQGIAVKQALNRLQANQLATISRAGSPETYRWDNIVAAEPAIDPDGMPRYAWRAFDPGAQAALESFWRIFSAIRIFRQLGTAQVVAVYTNLFAGVLVGMAWDEALDTALADSLADQLQVLTRDEQELIEAFVIHAGAASGATFVGACQEILKRLPAGRQRALLHALREADQLWRGATDMQIDIKALTDDQIIRVFQPGEPLLLQSQSSFRKRLRDLIGERGL